MKGDIVYDFMLPKMQINNKLGIVKELYSKNKLGKFCMIQNLCYKQRDQVEINDYISFK